MLYYFLDKSMVFLRNPSGGKMFFRIFEAPNATRTFQLVLLNAEMSKKYG